MIFNTWTFALFFVIAITLYWTVVPAKWRRAYLIAAGTVFYAASVPAYLLLIVVLSAITYGTAILLLRVDASSTRRRLAIMSAGVVTMIGVLFYFKYAQMFAGTISQLCHNCLPEIPRVVVPLAISFFTFEFVHLIVDVYQKKIERVEFWDFFTFALFFPTMVAGPIKRYQAFVPQLHLPITITSTQAYSGIVRVLCGLAKKTILADSMTVFTSPLTNPAPTNSWWDYAAAVLAYTAKIYFDFSGYSDIAIGVANLFGISILENFDRPYWSKNISEFWRRWHISLSSWIRDYVFIPLGGSRKSKAGTLANLGIAMALAGLWHGAAWHFVVWGLWHGAGLGVHRVWNGAVVSRVALLQTESRIVRGASIALTFGFVALGWVLFASDSLPHSIAVYLSLVGIHHA